MLSIIGNLGEKEGSAVLSRVLCIWELGGEQGHLAVLSNLNEALQQLGHEPSFALKDLSQAHIYFKSDLHRVFQAPVWQQRLKPAAPVQSFADALLLKGYRESGTLKSLVMAWRNLIESISAELIFTNYAPTAQIAARSLGLPIIAIGSGFAVEPPGRPGVHWQTFQPEVDGGVTANETLCLEAVNQVESDLGVPISAYLSDVNHADAYIFHHQRELDVYGRHRPNSAMYHPMAPPNIGLPVSSAELQDSPIVFAYLKVYFPKLEVVLEALCRLPVKVVVCCLGMSRSQLVEWRNKGLEIYGQILQLDEMLPRCRLLISHGGAGITSNALSCGIPFLGLPFHMENLSICVAARDSGVGDFLIKIQNPETVAGQIIQLMENGDIRKRCKGLQKAYKSLLDVPLSETVERAISLVLADSAIG